MSSIISDIIPTIIDNVVDTLDEPSECPICYDNISLKNNNCITPCGHQFCFKCLMMSIARNNRCPCCRANLQEESEEPAAVNVVEENEDSSDSEYDDNESESSDGDYEMNPGCTIERITETLETKGFTMTDLVAILLERFPISDPKYTTEFCEKLDDRFYDMVDSLNEEAARENREGNAMSNEDTHMGYRRVRMNLLPAFNAAVDAVNLPFIPAFEAPNLAFEPMVINHGVLFVEPSGAYQFI